MWKLFVFIMYFVMSLMIQRLVLWQLDYSLRICLLLLPSWFLSCLFFWFFFFYILQIMAALLQYTSEFKLCTTVFTFSYLHTFHHFIKVSALPVLHTITKVRNQITKGFSYFWTRISHSTVNICSRTLFFIFFLHHWHSKQICRRQFFFRSSCVQLALPQFVVVFRWVCNVL